MSLDRSLKTGGSLIQHRSVLSRTERIAKMKEEGQFGEDSGDTALGLPKMISRKAVGGKKKKAKGEDEGEEEEGESWMDQIHSLIQMEKFYSSKI